MFLLKLQEGDFCSMKRLLNAIKWDVRFQKNYGLYMAGTVLTLVWVGVLSLFNEEGIKLAVQVVLLADVSTMGLLFIGAILFFERGQGSISAVITTPLKTKEYVLSKVISLTVFITVFSVLLVVLTSFIKGIKFNGFYLMLAVLIIAVEYILMGFYLSTFFKNFTDFLLPMGLVFAFMNLPIFTMFNIQSLEKFTYLFYVIPSTGLVKLLQGLYAAQSGLVVLYAIVYNSLLIYVLFKLCIKNFNTKVIGREGDIDA